MINAEELFEKGVGISYSDFTILDVFFTEIDKKDISLETKLGKNISLKTPIIASPMDTVSSVDLCIALALQGGIGVLHYNYRNSNGKSDVDSQIRDIAKVKRHQNGFIKDPVTVTPTMTIEEVIAIEGINNFPVVDKGKLIGLLRKQDYSLSRDRSLMVKDRMLSLKKLKFAQYPITLNQAYDMMYDNHLPSLPIVDSNGTLVSLVTKSDLEKKSIYPLATRDHSGKLRVLFAVETWENIAYGRLEKAFGAGADGVVIDTSQGFTKYEKNMVEYIVKKYPEKLIIGGNISTPKAIKALGEWGVDAYRCGQGPGSMCTTADAIGISRSNATAVYECAKNSSLITIADGGIKVVGDIFKALSIGADVVMLGNLLAGTLESPGEIITDLETGTPVKVYRGMGSVEANLSGIRGYSKLPQGKSGYVPYRGSVHEWVPLIRDGLLSAFEVVNCKNIKELHEKKLMYEKKISRF